MNNYVIVCDLEGLSGHYDALIGMLRKLGAEPLQRSLWVLRESALEIGALRNDISKHLHPTDRLFVGRLESN